MTGREGSWPEQWRSRVRYLPWQARPRRNGKVGKVPLSPTGRPIDPLDRRAWQTWDAAWDTVDAGRADGVGLAITPGIRLTAVDLDDCVNGEGKVRGDAERIVEMFSGAYAEVSPSGAGLHLLVRAPCPPGWRRQEGIELIDRGFITITGRAYGPIGQSLLDHTDALAAWHTAAGPGAAAPIDPARQIVSQTDPDWFTRAWHARNGERFSSLWRGGLAGCASPSEADLHLLLIISYWNPTATDNELIAFWKQSGRARRKLKDSHYVARTVDKVRRLSGPVAQLR